MEARDMIETAMGYGKGYDKLADEREEALRRHEEAVAIVQAEGLPQIISKIRIGHKVVEEVNKRLGQGIGLIAPRVDNTPNNTPADMEKAALKIAYIAERSGQVACNIVSCGAIKPLVAMMTVPVEMGDEDDEFTMQEVAVKALHAICIGDACNQRPVAEGGAIPPMLKMLREEDHPWSIKEAAALCIARLAQELAGGPAQEIITARGGVSILVAVRRHPKCTEACAAAVEEALRQLLVFNPAKYQMQSLGVVSTEGGRGAKLVFR